MGEFENELRTQVGQARRELTAAREARDDAGIKSYGLRLRYLLQIAEEHHVELDQDESPGAAAANETGGV